MKDLINNIISGNKLKVWIDNFYDLDILFSYFEDKEDFFIFLFCAYSELLQKINIENSNENDIEYALNSFVYEFKKNRLTNFRNRNIDNNLSLIIVIEETNEDISHLYKIEENSIISKKYILSYDKQVLEKLKNEIDDSLNIVNVFNELAIKHSDKLQKKEEAWYNLLLKIFIKIPFLNYVSSDDESKKLENLEDIISQKLDKEQKLILKNILDKYDPNNTDIELFISSNLTDNEL